MADDMTLANGPREAVYYSLAVYNFAAAGTYHVDVELWTGDPCVAGSTIIAGSHTTFLNVPVVHQNGSHASLLEASLDSPIALPATVWMAVTFSGAQAAGASWFVARQAEIGSTANFFSENDAAYGCILRSFIGPSPWAGFWAQINCQDDQPSVPAASEWGLIVLSLIGLTAGTILFGRFGAAVP